MKNKFLIATALLAVSVSANAQTDKKQTKGEKVMETIKNLPDDLIAAPDAAVDTNANKLVNDNLSFVVPPLWKDKGTYTILEFKLQKCDVDPLVETFPLPERKPVQMLTMTMNTVKKTPADKKAAVLADVQKHLIAYFKEQGKVVTKDELTALTNSMVISSEPFTTTQGKTGELFFIHDIQALQNGLTALLLIPGAAGNSVTFVQLTYSHYVYETNLPEDPLELRTFTYADDQQVYVDFTKNMLKTLVIK
ncbi:MAG: hypothetical protein KA149_00235 [Chitinophagales bacterium]|nr:hypothetical protein [Chitinophagales bacterium]